MSGPRIGRPDVRAEFAQAQLSRDPSRRVLGLHPPGPDPVRQALGPRSPRYELEALPEKPRERLAALATAAQQLAAEIEPLPLALDAIAKRVRARITPAQRPGDDALVDDLHQLRDRAFALSLDVWRLERAATMKTHTGAGWKEEGRMTEETVRDVIRGRLMSGALTRERPHSTENPPLVGSGPVGDCSGCTKPIGEGQPYHGFTTPSGHVRFHEECERIWELERHRK